MTSPSLKKSQSNNLKYFYNTRRYLVWSGALVALMLGLIFFSLIPQVQAIFDNYNDMLDANRLLAQLRVKSSQLEQSGSSLVVANADKVSQTLPSRKPLVELLTGLGVIGNRTQVAFTNIALSPGSISTGSASTSPTATSKTRNARATSGSKDFDTLDLDLTVAGPINSVNQFLVEIEKLAPFTTVTAMSLIEKQSSGAGPQTPQFEAKLTISSYYFNKEITSKIDSSLPELSTSQREIIDQLQGFTYTTIEQRQQIQGGGLQNLFPGIDAIPLNI